MIGNMAVRITADRPNFPLGTLFVRAGSAANIALVGVPVRPGVSVTALALRVENVDGATADYAARAIGGVWVVDVPATHFATVGSVAGGVSVWATGTGADGETPRAWCVGVGDLEVLSADADAPAPAPGQTFWPLRMFDAAPTTPTKYNAYIDGAALKIWNGVAWITISGGSGTVDDTVTRTSANPVKSSGIWGAIWGALTALPTGVASLYDWCVAQLAGKLNIDGYTSWSITYPVSGYELLSCNWNRRIGASGGWAVELLNVSSGEKETFTVSGAKTITEIVVPSEDPMHPLFSLVREKMCKTKTSELTNDGNGVSPFATVSQIPEISGKADAADLRYRIAEAEYSASVGTAGGYILADRAVNLIMSADGDTSFDIELPEAVEEPTGVRRARDFILDIDNSGNTNNLALEFTALGVDYAFALLEDDSISEIMTIGAGERVRLYFTETPYIMFGGPLVFNVARVTLGDFVTSTTQGGN